MPYRVRDSASRRRFLSAAAATTVSGAVGEGTATASSGPACSTGLDRLFQGPIAQYRGARAGLLANPASVDRNYVHAVDRFAASREVTLAAIFGPQHGARADQQDNMIETGDEKDPRLGIPVYSLYGQRRKPSPQMLDGLDVVFCDLFDVGVRCYTFLWTMALTMEACAGLRKRFVVLDRPNPIGGLTTEGNVLDPEFRSFVGLYPVPMRHGFTAGELAAYLNHEFHIGAGLDVVEAQGWNRGQWLDRTGLPWIMPSPNMPSLETATVYPGSVLIEGTNLSEGRGTTRPFEIVGAPFIDAYRFADCLNSYRLPAVRFRPVWFRPVFDKWKEQLCGGVQIHVLDRAAFRACRTGLTLLHAAIGLYPGGFSWRQPPFEYEYRKLPIDILAGGDALRLALEKHTDPAAIEASWQPGLASFRRTRARYLRY